MRTGITIYFTRHGETDWNKALRYQGQHDVPLNETGRNQARRNAAALAALVAEPARLDYVASPLGRTRETMEIVREALGLPRAGYRTDDRLLELNYGVWQGQLAADLPQTDPAGVAWRSRDPAHWRAAGGESYVELTARVIEWLASINRDTVIAAHAGIGRVIEGHVRGLEPARVPSLAVPHDRLMVVSHDRVEWV